MDILRPALINIKGRVYRKNFIQEDNYEEEEEEEFSYMRPPGRLSWYLCIIYNSGGAVI